MVVYIPVGLLKNPEVFSEIVLNEFRRELSGSSIGVIFEADTL